MTRIDTTLNGAHRYALPPSRAEVKQAALTAAAAVLYRLPPTGHTVLQRQAYRDGLRLYCNQQIAAMWSRVAV